MSCSRSHSQEVADHPTALVCCFLCEAAPTALAQTEDSSFRLSLPFSLHRSPRPSFFPSILTGPPCPQQVSFSLSCQAGSGEEAGPAEP